MEFFSPRPGSSHLFEIGSAGHLGLMLVVVGLLGALLLFRDELPLLRRSRRFMARTAALILVVEGLSYAIRFSEPGATVFDILPLHLCASLKIAIATLILLERYDLVKPISTWAMAAGFVSFANVNLEGHSFGSFSFWHYVLGHLYLILLPVLLFLMGDFRYDLRSHLRSMAGLFLWSFVVFVLNAVWDTNYMYTGPHNHTAVPFIPAALMVWPLNYVSFALTGVALMSGLYAVLVFFQDRLDGDVVAGGFSPRIPAALTRES
jgi:hypothetical integral membrane protein (TIGR02206 family)